MIELPLFNAPVPIEPRKYEVLVWVLRVRMEPAAFSSVSTVKLPGEMTPAAPVWRLPSTDGLCRVPNAKIPLRDALENGPPVCGRSSPKDTRLVVPMQNP